MIVELMVKKIYLNKKGADPRTNMIRVEIMNDYSVKHLENEGP